MHHSMMLRLLCCCMFCCLFGMHMHAQTADCQPSTSSRCDSWPQSHLDLDQQADDGAVDFVFDDMGEYQGGITYYGSSILRVTASDTTNDGDCAWKLYMIVSNGGAPTATDEWQETAPYGTSGTIPTIGILEVRVSNACGTATNNGLWQTFSLPEHGGVIEMIDDGSIVNAAGVGGCSGNGEVNSAGSYLTSYGEFSYIIDYRIKPNFDFQPGKYELNIKFCIREDL